MADRLEKSPSWGEPEWEFAPRWFGAPPADSIVVLDEGVLSSFERGSCVTVDDRAMQWHVGAAYSRSGHLVPHSRRFGGISGDFLRSLDQDFIDVTSVQARLTGTHYYGGVWMEHFGHFLLETVPTLWAKDVEVPILFHPLGGAAAYKQDFLRLAGVESDPVFITAATQVERLVVPSRPVALNAWCTPAAVRVWEQIAERACKGSAASASRRIWLSRSRLESGDMSPNRKLGMAELDSAFADIGFEIIYPEELSVSEQVQVARSATIISGIEGSALHLSAFAQSGTRIMMLGSRNRPHGNRAQATIDSAVGNRLAVVPFGGIDDVRERIRRLL